MIPRSKARELQSRALALFDKASIRLAAEE